MATRQAACHCGQLRLEVAGEPFAISICNCLACQRRTGSAFGMQAGFKSDQVRILGRFSDPRAVVGTGATALRGRQVRCRGEQGPRARRGAPGPAVPLLQPRVLREPGGPERRRRRAPPPGDRHVGGLSRHGERGFRLRPDPRRAGVPGSDPLARAAPRPRRSRQLPQLWAISAPYESARRRIAPGATPVVRLKARANAASER